MKNKLLLFLSVALLGVSSCSSDENRADVNFIRAKFNGVELKFNIINVVVTSEITDPVTNYTYRDIITTATMNSDPSKILVMSSEYNITGENEIWRFSYGNSGEFYEINANEFNSQISNNSPGRYKGTYSGNLINGSGEVMTITNGTFDIIY